MRKYVLLGICSFFALLCACSKESGGTSAPTDGFATGKVVDTKGNPIANVEVTIENTLPGSSNSYVGATDANGNYKIKVGKVGTYHAAAYFVKSYNGKNYRLPLHSDNDDVFSNAGAVRNFQWKLSGAQYGGAGYYGSSIYISNEIGVYIDDEENIEYTLTPSGKIIDGSDGTVLKKHTGLPQTEGYGKLFDIPIGRYTMTAVYVHNGTRQPVRLKIQDAAGGFATSLTINFPETWYTGVAVTYSL